MEEIIDARNILIFELQRKVELLNNQCAELQEVVDAAVEWRRYGYAGKHEFCVGISPLLNAIDKYEGVERPATTKEAADG